MQTEDVEGKVLEWGTNLFREGYCCFENSIYTEWEQGLKNDLWTGEFRIHVPPSRISSVDAGEWPLFFWDPQSGVRVG